MNCIYSPVNQTTSWRTKAVSERLCDVTSVTTVSGQYKLDDRG